MGVIITVLATIIMLLVAIILLIVARNKRARGRGNVLDAFQHNFNPDTLGGVDKRLNGNGVLKVSSCSQLPAPSSQNSAPRNYLTPTRGPVNAFRLTHRVTKHAKCITLPAASSTRALAGSDPPFNHPECMSNSIRASN